MFLDGAYFLERQGLAVCVLGMVRLHVGGRSHRPLPLFDRRRFSLLHHLHHLRALHEMVYEIPRCLQCRSGSITLICHLKISKKNVSTKHFFLRLSSKASMASWRQGLALFSFLPTR